MDPNLRRKIEQNKKEFDAAYADFEKYSRDFHRKARKLLSAI